MGSVQGEAMEVNKQQAAECDEDEDELDEGNDISKTINDILSNIMKIER